MPTKIGKYTTRLDTSPSLVSFASVVSKKEGEGPLAPYFDMICDDTSFGEQTWEKAESRMQKDAVSKALQKANLSSSNIVYIFAGDLLNLSLIQISLSGVAAKPGPRQMPWARFLDLITFSRQTTEKRIYKPENHATIKAYKKFFSQRGAGSVDQS